MLDAIKVAGCLLDIQWQLQPGVAGGPDIEVEQAQVQLRSWPSISLPEAFHALTTHNPTDFKG